MRQLQINKYIYRTHIFRMVYTPFTNIPTFPSSHLNLSLIWGSICNFKSFNFPSFSSVSLVTCTLWCSYACQLCVVSSWGAHLNLFVHRSSVQNWDILRFCGKWEMIVGCYVKIKLVIVHSYEKHVHCNSWNCPIL